MRTTDAIPRAMLITALLCAFDGTAAELDRTHLLQNRFGLAVSVRPKAGTYSVTHGGNAWLGSGMVSVLVDKHWYRSANDSNLNDPAGGRLAIHDVTTGSSTDVSGSFDFVDLHWRVPGSQLELVTGFRMYKDRPFVVFVQRFPKGYPRYASGDWTVPTVAFPQFVNHSYFRRYDLHSWTSLGMFNHRFGRGSATAIPGTVDFLLLTDDSHVAMILSPFGNYLAATQQSAPFPARDGYSANLINCGIQGLVEDIPAGFEHKHILVAGQGIHNTCLQWGEALLEKAGKTPLSKYQDDVLKYFVYMDDYGSYYREHGFKEQGFAAYEDVVLGLEADARRHGLPIGAYFVLDSDQLRYLEGMFEPREDLFPRGVPWLRKQLGKPLQAYICWLAPYGPYRQKFPFIETAKGSRPWKSTPTAERSMGDVFYSLDYWRYTAEKLASWGVISLQHDYLSTYEGNKVMMSSVDKLDTYFKNMAKAMQEKGMTMHYCMQLPRNVMESTENPVMVSLQGSLDHRVATTEIKKSYDDGHDPFAWKHLIFTSAFYGAVGLWPSRDNIQTVADPNAYEDLLLANLLGGSMELGHKIGEANFDLLKRTYREGDGLILKPDRPIVPLDRCYIEGGVVGFTESRISGRRWYYVLSLPPAGYLPSFSVSDLGVGGRWAVLNYAARSVSIADATYSIPLNRAVKHEYFVVAPILENGMAVIGDVDKFVTMADQRIASVEAAGAGIRVGVVSNQAAGPLIAGYSAARPSGVEDRNGALVELSSLKRLRAARAGWCWDALTKLWYVKIDFSGARVMETRSFSIR